MEQNKAIVWFLTGSQHLYGEDVLHQVENHSKIIVDYLNEKGNLFSEVCFKTVLTGSEQIEKLISEANNDRDCIGVITWMHTFSPAKMWIAGMKILQKPLLHLHTQFNRDIPWDEIDMDFMNLNQSAHGGREYGFILSRMRKRRKVVAGYWKDRQVHNRIDSWMRASAAWNDWQSLKIARFGDNMREVAVTEGDKVEAQLKLGFSVSGYGVGDLVERVNSISSTQISGRIEELSSIYAMKDNISKDSENFRKIEDSIRIELGLRSFLEEGDFRAFTTTFEDLHGLNQLPGLAVQSLMSEGYGFGAEGDWKTAALVRAMKVMNSRLEGGTSFMEDYTYHLEPGGMKVLGAHMLEVCPSIAFGKVKIEVHPLGIGGKDDPARMVFRVKEGKGLNVSLMDMGNRFRMIMNPCKVVDPGLDLPKLPVARVLWVPEPDLPTSAEAWIHAGGAHHTGFSTAVSPEMIEDFADIADIELLEINEETRLREFIRELQWNDMYYMLGNSLKY